MKKSDCEGDAMNEEAMHLYKMLKYIVRNEHIPKMERYFNEDVTAAMGFLFDKYKHIDELKENEEGTEGTGI